MAHIHLQGDTSRLWTVEQFIAAADVKLLWHHVATLPLDKKPPIMVYGKTVHQNRDIGFFSDESSGYNYSKQIAAAKPLTPTLQILLTLLNQHLNTDFNGILINRYNDGSDYIGAHSDDERGLATGSVVAAISLGAERTFRIRHKDKSKTFDGKNYYDLKTTEGQLLVMDGTFQREYTHEIPKKSGVGSPRISLTFRKHSS